jgi:hypothetical protein
MPLWRKCGEINLYNYIEVKTAFLPQSSHNTPGFGQTRVLWDGGIAICGVTHQLLEEPIYIYVFSERNIRQCPFWPIVLWFWRVKNLQNVYLTRSSAVKCPNNILIYLTTSSGCPHNTPGLISTRINVWLVYSLIAHMRGLIYFRVSRKTNAKLDTSHIQMRRYDLEALATAGNLVHNCYTRHSPVFGPQGPISGSHEPTATTQ